MLAIVDKCTSAACKSLGIVSLGYPPPGDALLGTKRPAKSKRAFPVHEQVEWAIYDDWVNPEKQCKLYAVEKIYTNKSVPVVYSAISVLNISQ